MTYICIIYTYKIKQGNAFLLFFISMVPTTLHSLFRFYSQQPHEVYTIIINPF